MFSLVNNVPDTEKAASLLTFIHGKLYSLSNSLTTPAKLNCANYGPTFDTKANCHR